MNELSWDVVVVGAGAAGLFAAICAAERGRRVLVLEKNRKPGVKILMSGGTRCNITHDTDNRGIIAEYGTPGKFLHSALAAFSVHDTLTFFHTEGLATKVEETGKVFPVSNKATDVLAAILRRLERTTATLALGEPVIDIEMPENFVVRTAQRMIHADRVILTTGGKSYPGAGTTGDGYRIAQRFGHRILPTRPALVPLTTNIPWVGAMRGITLPDVGLCVMDGDCTLAKRRGAMLFAHFGLTGPAPLDVSRVVSGHPAPGTLTLGVDLMPNESEPALDAWLRDESLASGKKQLAIVLSQRLPRRMCDVVLEATQLPIDRKATGLAKADRQRLARMLKHLPIPLTGTLGFEKAEVTAGGVALDEVDSRTMQSKRTPGLFFAGEILDLDGPIGGYNFQAAWSTGWLAGASA
ncbi:MAG: aminoacetone oxidase family FAD-binding enzyme [Gemmataceae bacterium]|nr:aminoacetone oxidase family FAD-binding enzyme [Gemmataceae bacterium]